jgi:abortive infection bacteriophage resistance protein
MNKVLYNKSPLSFYDQVKLLSSRGLVVNDHDKAVNFLSYSNYYRFSAYCLPFEIDRHSFRPGTTFEQIRELYDFDRNLRDVFAQALETAEIFTRTKIAHILALKYGCFVHLDRSLFMNRFDWDCWHRRVIKETQRSRETFVKHFEKVYVEFPDMPIWVITEIISFGALSGLYKGLRRAIQKPIAKEFGIEAPVLQSWLHTLTYLRNLCAHHSRLWNRSLAIKPKLPLNNAVWVKLNKETPMDKIFCCVSILRYLLFLSDSGAGSYKSWGKDVENLFSTPPAVPNFQSSMGLPVFWQEKEYWSFEKIK